jgi:hypothetical protein
MPDVGEAAGLRAKGGGAAAAIAVWWKKSTEGEGISGVS